ncbi:YqaJ viral recombinase family protein [Diaphorobacter sp. ED-3]|uniref:YqaJ viral recombinase family protein n=1 Tax=Diaphorobacter sp. ED-3 TaxID=3016636 RepID=UPI0022DE37C5|nr:YqaJ viral recombinase family protein [Diaphorobacter sp. ED-3]
MITHNLVQGTSEWHAYRAAHDNASDAPAMMGVSSYKTRDQLIAERATGIVPDVDAATQRLFDSGHRFEALARPLAEKIIGEDLYPCTGSQEGSRLSASFDGLTMLEDVAFEHKRMNSRLRDVLSTPGCTGADLPMEYQIQMEQQCAVSGCERVLFMASDWDDQDQLIEEMHCWYTPNLELRAQIIAGWEQFHKDVAAYVAPEAKPAPVVGKTPDNLPALLIQVTGAVTASNLPEFKARALEVFKGINRTLTTDQDFATAESTVKWCADVESRLAAAKEHALSQTATIDELFRTIDDISAEARRTRLELDKLVKARKEEIRGEIVAGGIAALREHIAQLNAAMPAPYMPQVPADFAGAIKGKRTVESLRGAVNDELARAKIEASNIATRIHANVKTLKASGLVVPDAATLVLKAPDDLAATIATRKAAEQQRLEAERERIRQEEAARADREARAKLEAEQRAAQAEIAQAAQTGMLAAPVAADLGTLVQEKHAEAVAGLDAQQVIGTAQRAAAAGPAVVPLRTAAPAERTGTPTLKLGTINERLGGVLTISADGLRSLGFEIVARERGACLYHEADFPLMLAALVRHIEGVQAKAAA